MKRIILGLIAVFVAWTLIDILVHGVLLMDTYAATAHLWRPEAEMKMGVMHAVRLATAGLFVWIYAQLIANKSLRQGLYFGCLFGLISGIPMGFGSYSYMPIDASLACAWFAGSLASGVVGGLLVGALVRESCC